MDLYEFGESAIDFYANKKNRFANGSLLSDDFSDGSKLVKLLMGEIPKHLDLLETPLGITIQVKASGIGLLTLTTHDLSGGKLKRSRWSPLVLDALCLEHDLKYEDFWLKDNKMARIMLGRDLKDLTIPVKRSVLDKLSPNSFYLIDSEGNKVVKNHAVDYEDKELRILRFKSPLYSVVYDEYPKNYEPGLSKELMRSIINVK